MLTTARADLDARFRLLRQHGMSVPDTVRHASRDVVFESYPVLGFNYRMTDIQAAIGREQLTRLPAIVERRRELASRYAEALARVRRRGRAHRAGVGAQQLAELRGAPRARRPADGDAAHAGRRHRHAPRRDERAHGAGLSRGDLAIRGIAGGKRARASRHPGAAALPPDDLRRAGPRGRVARRGPFAPDADAVHPDPGVQRVGEPAGAVRRGWRRRSIAWGSTGNG